MKTQYLLIVSVLLLSACGFHLRGSQVASSTDIANIYIRTSNAPKVSEEIQIQLGGSGTKITKAMEEAEYVLGLSNEKIRRSVLSVSASTGKVEEFQLILSVNITVGKPGETTLLASETVRVARDYTFDEDAVLGKFAEEQALREELISQAASQIIRRLDAVTKNS